MTAKAEPKSRIMEAVHEGARDLHRLGFIDKRKMQKYDVLCLVPVQDYDAKKVKALRERLQLSQAVLASVPGGKSAALLVCMTVIPAALLLIAYFIYRAKYTITEEAYETMVREIAARHAAKGEKAE